MRAYDGDLTAVQAGGVGIMNCSYLRFEGIDFGVTNSHCVNLGGTEPSWGDLEREPPSRVPALPFPRDGHGRQGRRR